MRQFIACILVCVVAGATVEGCTTFTRNADAGVEDASGGPPSDTVGDVIDDAASDVGEVDGDAASADVLPDAPDGGDPIDTLTDVPDGALPDAADAPDAAPDSAGDAEDAADGQDIVAPPDVPTDIVDPCPAEPCVTPGLRVCTPDAVPVVLQCGPGDDGCLTWTVQATCDGGQACRNGACGVDECPSSGLVECTPDAIGYRICGADADGFLIWGPVYGCPSGNTCKGAGQCGKDACPAAAQTACYGVAQLIVCELDASGFLAWSAPAPCGLGGLCKGGACGVDECDFVGQVNCMDDLNFMTCYAGDDGFLRWGEPQVCDAICKPGVGCGSVCTNGEKACSGASSTVTCVETGGVDVWSEPSPCPPGQLCKGAGACGKDQCLVVGAKVCSTVEGNQTLVCTLEPSGFMKWAPSGTCLDGQVCKGAGVCGTDACAAGKAECIDDQSLRVCEVSAAGFFEWSAPFGCPAGSFCLGSVGCVPEGPVQINTDPLLEVSGPAIGALPGGGAIVAWTRTVADTSVVVTRAVDGAANPLGSEQPVNDLADSFADQIEPAVAGASDGRYVVAWVVDEGQNQSIRATVLGGASAGPTIVSAPGGENRHPTVGALPAGGYLIVWESTGTKCAGARCLLQRRLGADGSPVTEVAAAFDVGGTEEVLHASLGTTPNGGAWIAARQLTAKAAACHLDSVCPEPPCCADTGVVQTIAAVGLAADGSLTVPPQTLDSTGLTGLGAPSVAVDPVTGQARIAWVGDPDSINKGVRFACLEPQALQVCTPQIVSKGGGNLPVSAAVASQLGGTFVVGWAAQSGVGKDLSVYTRRVAADGSVLTDPTQASLGLVGTHQNPALVRRADGVAAIVWEAHEPNGKHAIRLRIVKPN